MMKTEHKVCFDDTDNSFRGDFFLKINRGQGVINKDLLLKKKINSYSV